MALDDHQRLRPRRVGDPQRLPGEQDADPPVLPDGVHAERREHQDRRHVAAVANEIGPADEDLADDRATRRTGELRDERQLREVGRPGPDRGDQGRDLRIVEGGELEPVDRREVGRPLRPDDEVGGRARMLADGFGQRAAPATASRSPSGTGRRCSTGWT
jgi:hypothetical protein